MKNWNLKHLYISCIAACAIAACAPTKPLHVIHPKAASELHRFFEYQPNRAIISGHRGSTELGLPENSIASMQTVLEHTPAFFEIDPRLTKDSVVILMHDATLDRTTNGTGKVSDYTWAELQQLRLKDRDGNLTEHGIPTLAETIKWARGKTVLNLDRKDVPMEMTAALIAAHNAYAWVMVTVHSPEQAAFYLGQHPDQMLSAHIRTVEQFEAYRRAGIPFNRMIAYIGPTVKPDNQTLYQLLHAEGASCMISSASSYDKLPTSAERAAAYRAIIADGATILESDFPIEAARALQGQQ